MTSEFNETNCHTNSSHPLCGLGDVQGLYAARVSVATLLILITFLLNSSLLYVLWRVRYAKVIRDDGCGHYIINLCVIDLLAALICSVCVALYRLSQTCHQFKVFWVTSSSLQILLSSGWIATVAVMMRDRLRIANNPLLKRRTFWRMTYGLAGAWLWAAANTSPQLFLHDYISVDVHWACPHVHDEDHNSHKLLYCVIRIVLMFFVPSCIILLSSFGILRHHFTAENSLSLKRKKGHQRFVYLVFLLWVTFTVSNLPKHLLEIGFTFTDAHTLVERYEREKIIMYILLVSWSIHCVSPVVYFVAYKDILGNELRELAKQTSCLRPLYSSFSRKHVSLKGSKNSKGPAVSTFNASDELSDWDDCFNQNKYLLQNLGLLDQMNKPKPVAPTKKLSLAPFFSSNSEEGVVASMRRMSSQPLLTLKKKSVSSVVNPYLVSTKKYSVHTLQQNIVLENVGEEEEGESKTPKRKLPTFFQG